MGENPLHYQCRLVDLHIYVTWKLLLLLSMANESL